jgi:hypoxanthine phosphoribosyltransferase
MGNGRNILHKIISRAYPLIPVYEVVDLDYIKRCSGILADRVSSEYRPDCVVGIANGGLYPALEVSHRLGCEMDSMQISHYRNRIPVLNDVPGAVKVLRDFISINPKAVLNRDTRTKNFEGKKVLLVDDEVGCGDTLELAKQVLRAKKPHAMRTATIFRQAPYKPDFFVVENFRSCIIKPWRKSSPYYEAYLEKMTNLGLVS